MFEEMERQRRAERRRMLGGIIVILLAGGLLLVTISGCAIAPMTAKSKLSVPGPVATADTTITLKIVGKDTTKTVVIHSANKSPAGGDFDLKKVELEGRTKIGVAEARAKGARYFQGYPGYMGYPTGYYPSGVYPEGYLDRGSYRSSRFRGIP